MLVALADASGVGVPVDQALCTIVLWVNVDVQGDHKLILLLKVSVARSTTVLFGFEESEVTMEVDPEAQVSLGGYQNYRDAEGFSFPREWMPFMVDIKLLSCCIIGNCGPS